MTLFRKMYKTMWNLQDTHKMFDDMKNMIIVLLLLGAGIQSAFAQKGKDVAEGTGYYLPRTELRFTVKMEKTSYTPGEFAVYAEKYMRMNNVKMQPSVSYRIIDLKINSVGERDTSKFYVVPADSKYNVQSLQLDENGVLLAVNAEPKDVRTPEPFRPAPKPAPLNPRDYMNEDVLSAGSSAKMAELCALEIYDIRDSKSLLSKGQADFMPKDGEQLRIMLDNLDMQERGLLQLFAGVTVRDTMETVVSFVPVKAVDRQLLFRFSKWMGMTDADDLGGNPYYISVEDKNVVPSVQESLLSTKKAKDNGGFYVNLPGKIKITLYKGDEQWAAYELYAAQFGNTAALDEGLFGKKMFTGIVLNPVTGNLESINVETLKR